MSVLFDYDSVRLFAVEHGDFLRWSFFFLLLAIVVIVAGAVILYHKLRKAGFRKASIALLGIGVCVAVGAVKPGTNGVNRASVRGVRAVDSLETSGDGESAPQGFRPTRFAVATNRLEVSVAWDEDDEIGLIAYRTAHSLSPPVWSPYSCVTEFLDPTGHLWTVDVPSTNSSFFVEVSGHSLDGDADEDGVSNGRELSLGTDPFSAHSDADWLTDGQELGVASVCRPSGFLWFEISSEGRNELWQSADDWDTWVELDGGLRIGRTNYRCAVMSLDGFCNLLPDFNWRQDQVVSWSGTNRLETTDFSRGAISVLPFGADLWGTSGVSGMYVESVCSNDVTYDVLEWKNVGPDNGNRGTNGNASFEVIIPSDETNTLYVSYLGLGGSAASADPVCGVQDSSRRSAVDPTSFYAIPSPRAPKAGMTVKYVFGENTDPTVDDPEWMYVGQGDDWVRANFARLRQVVPSLVDVEEILSVGYTNWVDACVGRGLTNGLYKLTAHVTAPPPSGASLSVGDCKVNFDGSSEYAFLLEKGRRYDLSVSPSSFTNIVFSAADDIASGQHQTMQALTPGLQDGYWTEDRRGLVLRQISFGLPGLIIYYPHLYVNPGNWQPTAQNPSVQFFAVVTDICSGITPTYSWSTSDPEVVSVSWPATSSAVMTAHYPAAATSQVDLSLTVGLPDGDLHSHYVHASANPDSQVRVWVEMPSVLFVNDDDDDGDGHVDYDVPWENDEDVVRAKVHVESDVPTNGTLRLVGVTGYFGILYADAEFEHEIESGQAWPLSVYPDVPRTVSVYLNPHGFTGFNAGELRFRWVPSTGYSIDARSSFTVVEPVVEPICSEFKEVTQGGVTRKYVYNPCGIVKGEKAYFKIGLKPRGFPDSEIVWSSNNDNVRFVGGNTGREVCVIGESTGDVELTIGLRDAQSGNPCFKARVVEMSEVKVTCFVARGPDGNPVRTDDEIDAMISGANDVLLQIGIRLVRGDSIVEFSLPCEGDIAWDVASKVRDMKVFDEVVDMYSETGGLELYFVRDILDVRQGRTVKTTGGYSPKGIVVTRNGNAITLAHEVGHALGMDDLFHSYASTSLGGLELRREFVFYDWNGGCDGPTHDTMIGEDVTSCTGRYYRNDLFHYQVINRLLMNGRIDTDGTAEGLDITFGPVYGYDCDGLDHNVDCGAFIDLGRNNTRQPVHR